MNSIREILKINEEELRLGLAGTKASWHDKYAQSAWVYAGNLDQDLTEGDVLAVLSQWGEIEDLHLARDEATGESRGFCFCKYEDARSCVLAVDNFCGVPLCGRSLRVDHVENYRLPKHLVEEQKEQGEDAGAISTKAGHAYEGKELASEFTLHQGQDLFAPAESSDKKQGAAAVGHKEEKDESKQAKKQRKEERKRLRGEKEQRKAEREEKRRERRARKMERKDDGDEDDHGKKKHKKRKREKDDSKQRRHDSDTEENE